MDRKKITEYVENFVENKVMDTFSEYIKLPNLSPNFDPEWNTNGYQDKAANLIKNWVIDQKLQGMTQCHIHKQVDRTCFLFIELAPFNRDNNDIESKFNTGTNTGNNLNKSEDKSILFYGHLDKQPPFTGWDPDLGPNKPVRKNGKFYGRGTADDGYAVFSVVSAIKTCQDNNYSHPLIKIIIEGAEESNQVDLLYYISTMKEEIGTPTMMICLDSGCIDFERLWVETNMRGIINLHLKVSVLEHEIHSGAGGGFIPDSFMIIRELLDRLEDPNTGNLKLPCLNRDIPEQRLKEIESLCSEVGESLINWVGLYEKTGYLKDSIKECMINNTFRTSMTVVGCDGFPESESSGNILRSYSTLRLSFRIPPGCIANDLYAEIEKTLLANPPYGAKVEVINISKEDGWEMRKPLSNNVLQILSETSKRFFDKDIQYFGGGCTVPFLHTLAEKFPTSDIVVTGAINATSGIHGPNENLDEQYFKTYIACLANIMYLYK